MKKSLMVGIILTVLTIAVSFITLNSTHLETYLFYLTVGLLVLAILLSGIAVSGDRVRINVAYEDKEDRTQRFRYTIIFLVMALPSFIAVSNMYTLTK